MRFMRRTLLCASFGCALLLSALPVVAAAQDFMTPTEHHKAMAEDVGTWDGEVSMWHSADAEPMKSKGVETNKMLGKMWLLSEYEGDMGGEKFQGRSATGYDPVKKKFYGGWLDTMSPFMMKFEGDYDEDSKTLTMTAETTSVMTGKPEKYKLVTTWDGKEKKTFELHMVPDDGKEWKMMEIKYTRRK
jgi:hypothetical protein